ncbi:hypothetical protein AX23_11295 [Brucella melitensis 548]|nr:hypothetical protein AX23_11295 [Brucella melitensis 548]
MQRTARTQRYEDHVALGSFGRLTDSFRHFTCLAMTEAHAALLVANNDERSKTEATAALDDLGNTVDVNELIDEFAVALLTAALFAVTFSLCHILISFFFSGSTNAD